MLLTVMALIIGLAVGFIIGHRVGNVTADQIGGAVTSATNGAVRTLRADLDAIHKRLDKLTAKK